MTLVKMPKFQTVLLKYCVSVAGCYRTICVKAEQSCNYAATMQMAEKVLRLGHLL